MRVKDDSRVEFSKLPTVSRRQLLVAAGGSAAALAFLLNQPDPATASVTEARLSSNPFTLGIASGEPRHNSVVLWTRLAPEPFEPHGGLHPDRAVVVRWQVASDENFATVVRQGTDLAHSEYAFSMHIDVRGLKADRVYYYRFSSGGHLSEIGRTRTAPAPGTDNSELTLAFASCNSFGAGWFTSANHLADEDVDVVLFLGDYIYEYPLTTLGSLRDNPPELPSVFNSATGSLSRYRLQYAAYKSEPELQRAHRSAPWIMTWDDHEVVNNYHGDDPDDPLTHDDLVRRANAYRAYWEHLPMRRAQVPKGPDARLYRSFDYGTLARLSMLDVRQYRSAAAGSGAIGDTPERRDPERTMLGEEQESWYFRNLTTSRAQWNLTGQGVLMSMLDTDPGEDRRFSAGGWDGYQASQQRVLDTVAQRNVENFVVLTGDIHRNYVLDMLAQFDEPESAVIGAEFAATSLSSGGDGVDSDAGLEDRFRANPHLKWGSLQRGYARVKVDRQQLQVDIREVPYVSKRGAPVTTKKSFVVESGTPGIKEA